MAHQLHASEGGMYMDKEDTLSAMKDGVSSPISLICDPSFQTTIISIKYAGGIMLAADARSSNVSCEKINQNYAFAEHVCGQPCLR